MTHIRTVTIELSSKEVFDKFKELIYSQCLGSVTLQKAIGNLIEDETEFMCK